MKTKVLVLSGLTALGMLLSCNKELIAYEQGDMKIAVVKGEEWLHPFPLFAGIKKKNPPQIAIWIEDMQGRYVSTVYVSHKIATEGWSANRGNRRKEALPAWCFARGIQYPDGLYLPTKGQPVTDGISGATPQGNFQVKIRPAGALRRFVVKIELNHSADWNDHYPKQAKEGEASYSGGKGGSGQPAVVYSATVDLDSDRKRYPAILTGHSSPDGSNGTIDPDTTTLTTALHIVKEITINIQ